MKKISVIVPVYNVERYLKRCIDSIINQTYSNLEIILIDDGSTDKSGAICDEYKEKNDNLLVVHKENGGLSSARNEGLNRAGGDYIIFVDSDDWLPIDSISYLYELIEYDGSDFAMGHFYRCGNIVDTNLLNKNDVKKIYSSEEFLKLFFKINSQENVQYAWGKIYKRELFSKVRFPLGLIDEDIPVMFDLIIASKNISYSTHIVYYYYLNTDSITLSNFSEKKFDLLTVWDMVVEKSKKNSKEWIKRYAVLNRKRANFGLLCNLICSPSFEENIKKYKNIINELIKCLRKDSLTLMKSPIPFSRKAMIIIFCISFKYVGFLMNKIYLLKNSIKYAK